jgi:hypothetical protein
VRRLAKIMCTNEEIASIVGCSSDTLERRFAVPIKEGRDRSRACLRRMQLKAAKMGNVSMLIWLGKQFLGQSEKVEQVVDGKVEQQIVYTTQFGANVETTPITEPT